jgi:hypothetical protein
VFPVACKHIFYDSTLMAGSISSGWQEIPRLEELHETTIATFAEFKNESPLQNYDPC